MALDEFGLIRRYFKASALEREDVALGIGDDCALLRVPADTQLAVSIDSLVAGVHFLPDVDPETLGHKVLAVNLSDLAAMGAEPAWVTLALTLPEANLEWLEAFSRGFSALAKRHAVQLVGGDTTRGPLSITIQAHGFLPLGEGLLRSGARVGDLVCVTGTLGDAGLALKLSQHGDLETAGSNELRARLEKPEPRLEAGLALRGVASAAIDISDGLLADLGHLLDASGVGATIMLDQLPLSDAVSSALVHDRDWSIPLASGDDYELCFTLPPSLLGQVQAIGRHLQLPICVIGQIEAMPGLRCVRENATLWKPSATGFNHFANE